MSDQVAATTGGDVGASPDEAAAAKRRAQAEARAQRAAARAALRAIPPQRDPDFVHLSLEDLREYRRALADEENRVSYWRRILQARLDTMDAGSRSRTSDLDHLRPVLTQDRITRGRTALISVLPVDDIPPLPNLAELWDSDPDPSDPAAWEKVRVDLIEAERELSEYRSALHRRINAATGELIARYHENPALCLSVLPLDRP